MNKFMRILSSTLSIILIPTILFASDLESWRKEVQASVELKRFASVASEDVDGCTGINVVLDELDQPIAVIKGNERAKREAFIYNFAESIGLRGCVAPVEEFEKNGPVLIERFIRVEETHPISSVEEPLRKCLLKHVDARGALTVLRAKNNMSVEDLKLFISYISQESTEKLDVLHVLTGSFDDLPRNTLVRINKYGLLDLVLTDTNLSFDSNMYPTCTALKLPHARYSFSSSRVKYIASLDMQKLDEIHGPQIALLFGDDARVNFKSRGKHFQSAATAYPALGLRELFQVSFLLCPLLKNDLTLGQIVLSDLAFGGFDQLLRSGEDIELRDHHYQESVVPDSFLDKTKCPTDHAEKLVELMKTYEPYMTEEEREEILMPSCHLEFITSSESFTNHLKAIKKKRLQREKNDKKLSEERLARYPSSREVTKSKGRYETLNKPFDPIYSMRRLIDSGIAEEKKIELKSQLIDLKELFQKWNLIPSQGGLAWGYRLTYTENVLDYIEKQLG